MIETDKRRKKPEPPPRKEFEVRMLLSTDLRVLCATRDAKVREQRWAADELQRRSRR